MKGKVGATSAIVLAAGLVAYWEGLSLTGYADVVGVPTICYGHTGGVTVGQRATREECEALLHGDLAIANADVRRCIRVPLEPHQEAALTSFALNVGGKALCGSTLARKANAGDMAGACTELDRWVYARGIKFRGLVKRRAAERALCEGKAG